MSSAAPARIELPTERPPSSDEQARANDLADLLKPKVGTERVDAFAKWILISTGMIAVLGVGLSNFALSTLSGLGKIVFGMALASIGLSVASSALSFASQWHAIGPFSRDSMLAAINAQFAARRKFLVIASVSFAIALFFAGIAPLASDVRFPLRQQSLHHSLAYNLDAAAGSFQATLSGDHLVPGSPVELILQATPRDRSLILPRGRVIADASGVAKVTVIFPHVDMVKGPLLVFTRVVEAPGQIKEDTLTVNTQ